MHPNTPPIEQLEFTKEHLLSIKDRNEEEQKKFEAVTIQLENIYKSTKTDE